MLQAARAVFAEKGFTAATLEEVAQRAEFGKGTLYNYFPGGKEEILFAIFDELYDDFHALVTGSFAPHKKEGRPFRAVFYDFVRRCFVFFQERHHEFMILIREAQRMIFSDDTEKAAYFQRQRDRLVEALTPHIEEAIAAGDVRPLPPQAVGHMVFGNINGYHMHVTLLACRCRPAEPPETDPDRAADFITTVVLDGLTPRSA